MFLGLGLLAAVVALSGCASLQRDRWLGADKLKHLAAGTAIAAGSTYAAREAGADIEDARAIGVTMVITVGAGKELYDRDVKKTFWSWQDMSWNLIGALLGSYLVRESD